MNTIRTTVKHIPLFFKLENDTEYFFDKIHVRSNKTNKIHLRIIE